MPSSKERELTVPHFKEFLSERQYSNLDENHQKSKGDLYTNDGLKDILYSLYLLITAAYNENRGKYNYFPR